MHHRTACVVLWPGLNSFITVISSTGSYSWKLQESCFNSKEKGKKEGFSAIWEGKSQRHHTQYKEKLNSLQEVHLQHAVSDLFIPALYRIPKGTEGGMWLSQDIKTKLEKLLPVAFHFENLRWHSYSWHSKGLQIHCLFSYLARQFDSQFGCSTHSESVRSALAK